jgi:hypothetical protein
MTSNDVEQDMTSARLLSYSFESLPFPGTHKELIDKLYSNTIREGRRLSGNVTHDAGNRMMKHEKGHYGAGSVQKCIHRKVTHTHAYDTHTVVKHTCIVVL